SLGRKFVRISLGGVRDEAEIRGHRRTYVGAIPGRIVNGIKEAKTKNPVFLLDEIDKMSADYKGDPSSAMLEVLDPEQNKDFVDHYLEMPFDLSKILFVTTANSLSTIPRALLDRMEIIEVSGYIEDEKLNIAKKYLLPKQMKDHALKADFIKMEDEAIKDIINSYTREAGVRSLERTIGKICRKVAKKYVETPSLEEVVVTKRDLDEDLGKNRFIHQLAGTKPEVGVVTGLAWTSVGGETLTVEVNVLKGKGQVVLTGKLGDVMKESAQTAISYIRSIADRFNIDYEFYKNNDIHIHIPEGAVPKDGPSAGITMALAVISALTNLPVLNNVAMTGEITLRGRVLAVGGVREKLLAAHRAGITKVLLPKECEADLDEIPKNIKEKMEFVLVEHMDEVLEHALLRNGEK
ncbi:MAG TPA: endopeptidase La, partial [Peptostreptococcaceae bacterium]|nr:endopeptidase La [Peptostreptococcaceae bacterium]